MRKLNNKKAAWIARQTGNGGNSKTIATIQKITRRRKIMQSEMQRQGRSCRKKVKNFLDMHAVMGLEHANELLKQFGHEYNSTPHSSLTYSPP